MILWLIVSATRRALSNPPIAIVIATAKKPQRISIHFKRSSIATILGVSFKPRAKLTTPALRKCAPSMICCARQAEHRAGVTFPAILLLIDRKRNRRLARKCEWGRLGNGHDAFFGSDTNAHLLFHPADEPQAAKEKIKQAPARSPDRAEQKRQHKSFAERCEFTPIPTATNPQPTIAPVRA